jgi:ribosomal protein L13
MKTYSQKSAEISRKWYLIDASESTIGRVSTVAASLLIGKGKPTVTHHMDGGDYEALFKAIRGMLPVNKLRDGRLERLKIYNDDQHKHAPQNPEVLSLKKGNK